ncbi:MAG: hypothetical protein D6804_03955 [Aquificota bacterium]|nr:MAG: hypothetical protein D6804_03955 [Aquificota bacterium]
MSLKDLHRVGVELFFVKLLQMMSARNLTSHTYDQSLAEQVIKAIVEQYMSEFEKLQNAFERLEKEYEQSSS